MSTTVENLLDDPLLGLDVAAGHAGLWRRVLTQELNRPCLELTGYFDAFRAERIQVLGKGEVTYIEVHEARPGLRENVTAILAGDVPCVIVTNGLRPPSINHVTIPVRPGRNVGTLVEVAALNHKLKHLGVHTARRMEETLLEEMERGRRARLHPSDQE